jgi:hypothetical protein
MMQDGVTGRDVWTVPHPGPAALGRLGLLALLALVALGCHKGAPALEPYEGASVIQEERDIVNEVIPDSARRADIMAILDRTEARLQRFTEEVAPLGDSLRVLFRSRDATDEQITDVYRSISELRADALRDFMRHQLEIREITFANEWAEISGRDERLIGN